MADEIVIRGARQHNLKNINVAIPRARLVVITGPSGSGKTSLAFDTIYAEGQRRYVESLNTYARQFLQRLPKPEVDLIDGLSPAISVRQQSAGSSPRSTVGTLTEIYDFLRLLYARFGIPHCPKCGRRVVAQTVQQIVDRVMDLEGGTRFSVQAPAVRDRRGSFAAELEAFRREGFVRVVIDGQQRDLAEDIRLTSAKHSIDVLVDRLRAKPDVRQRLTESIELALRVADGMVRIVPHGEAGWLASERYACIECGVTMAEFRPAKFSFNSPEGACSACDGLGEVTKDQSTHGEASAGDEAADEIHRAAEPCPRCQGARLKPEALAVRFDGKTIAETTALNLKAAHDFFHAHPRADEAAQRLLEEVVQRLRFLMDLGLDYLSLDRRSDTLSGGEGERIRLATQIGAGLVGVLYVLDEPSMGLHARDNARLVNTLRALRDRGNSVIVVEHSPSTIRAADHVIDMGPGAGRLGGEVVAQGTVDEILADARSLTGQYLSGARVIGGSRDRRLSSKAIELAAVNVHNLQNVSVSIPLGVMTCLTGVSGSGKSSLAIDTLLPHARRRLNAAKGPVPAAHVRGLGPLDKVVHIDQRPIGRTPRSNPASYGGFFSLIRAIYIFQGQDRYLSIILYEETRNSSDSVLSLFHIADKMISSPQYVCKLRNFILQNKLNPENKLHECLLPSRGHS